MHHDGWSESQPEVEWDERERAVMLALAEVRAGECGGCGNPLEDSTDLTKRSEWSVPPPGRCWVCTSLGMAHDRYRESVQPQALRFGTIRTNREEEL